MDGWNTTFLLGRPIFRGYVSFRESYTKSKRWHWVSLKKLWTCVRTSSTFRIFQRMLMVGSLIFSDGFVFQGPTIHHVLLKLVVFWREVHISRCFCLCIDIVFVPGSLLRGHCTCSFVLAYFGSVFCNAVSIYVQLDSVPVRYDNRNCPGFTQVLN